MNKEFYISAIGSYLQEKRWKNIIREDGSWYCKEDTFFVPKPSKFVPIETIYGILLKGFKQSGREEFHFNSVINPYSDTDYIIAGVQAINKLLRENEIDTLRFLYSFQPVIRSVPKEKQGQDGFLPCFVNVCSITFDAEIQDYFDELELWITLLSKCSIHARAIRLKVKTKTNAYDGIGLKLQIGQEEIGQCNLYEIDYHGRKKLITDFGFGLERICWAANGFSFFQAIHQSYFNYGFGLQDFSNQLSLITLMLLSNIRPNSTKYGYNLRRLIERYAADYGMWDYSKTMMFYYNYWSNFIKSSMTFPQIKIIFETELQYQLKQIIVLDCHAQFSKKYTMVSADDMVLKLIQCHAYDYKEKKDEN